MRNSNTTQQSPAKVIRRSGPHLVGTSHDCVVAIKRGNAEFKRFRCAHASNGPNQPFDLIETVD